MEPRTGASSHLQLAWLHLQQAIVEAFSPSSGRGRAEEEDDAALEQRLSRAAAEPPAATNSQPSSPTGGAAVPYDLSRSTDVEPSSPQGLCIVDPTGVWKGRWDLVVMVLILYSAGSVPVRLGFDAEAEGKTWVFEAGMSILFIFDLLLSFRTAYTSEEVHTRGAESCPNRPLPAPSFPRRATPAQICPARASLAHSTAGCARRRRALDARVQPLRRPLSLPFFARISPWRSTEDGR